MKRTLLLISTVLLSAIAGVQTAWGQKITLYMAGNQTHEYDISQVDSLVFSDASTEEEIVVTVDANGNADGEHWFEKIDETNFYIDDIKYTAQSGDLVVTGYNQAFFKGAARIISKLKYNGRTINVVSITKKAFYECGVLTSVTIGNGVTSIGEDTFSGCSALTSITIPKSVTSIGGYAFFECTGLTSVTIGNGVTSIARYAFNGCSSLTSITIPNSVTSIGNFAFEGCTRLTSVTIGSGVRSIGEWAFCGCRMTSITIPNSVKSIAKSAFGGCTKVTSVTIGSGVTSIGSSAFSAYNRLTDVYCFAENVPETNGDAFWDSSISSATLHVPASSVDAYKAAEPWKYFKSIVAIE